MRDARSPGRDAAAWAAREQAAAVPSYEGTFCLDDLPVVRRLAAAHGGDAGLDSTRLADFVLAVNEAVTNAFCRGCDRARLRLWVDGDGVFCDVFGGRWIYAQQPSAIRPDDPESLRLWVIQRVCNEVAFAAGPNGTTVQLSMTIPLPASHRPQSPGHGANWTLGANSRRPPSSQKRRSADDAPWS